MTFNIGQQTAGIVNNVAGDQHIAGDQQGSAVSLLAAREAWLRLRAGLSDMAVGQETLRPCVEAIHQEMQAPEPDRQRVGHLVRRLTSILTTTGAFAAAATPLIGPLQTLVSWLGVHGAAVLPLL
jgi:hypothetical protein